MCTSCKADKSHVSFMNIFNTTLMIQYLLCDRDKVYYCKDYSHNKYQHKSFNVYIFLLL